jgi:hypothetical protein
MGGKEGKGLRQTPRETDFLGKFGANPTLPTLVSRGLKDRKRILLLSIFVNECP